MGLRGILAAQCPLFDKVPNIKSAGNLTSDSRAAADRADLVGAIQFVWGHADLRSDVRSHIRQLVKNKEGLDHIGPGIFQELPTAFGRLGEKLVGHLGLR